MKKVIHLIPYDGTGGVEVAARSMRGLKNADIDFSVESIYANVPGYQNRKVTYGLRPLLLTLKRIRAQSPDLLIVSLWRAGIVGILMKLMHPKLRLILMLHSTKDAHWLDKAVTRCTGLLADEWWGDSAATLKERMPRSETSQKKMRVISFVTRSLQPVACDTPSPNFVFWGRLTAIKGLHRAIGIFAQIAKIHPSARFSIIGPDGGAKGELQEAVAASGVQQSVVFRGEMDIAQICAEAAGSCFYLQASKYEGMAMSVVEAMQLGLVPVVTPVGEISNYCRHRVNAILIHSDSAALAEVLQLLENPDRYREMQRHAAGAWRNTPVYSDSVMEACKATFGASTEVMP